MSVVDELVTLLGLKTDPAATGEASKFGKVIGGITKMAVAAGAALIAASLAIKTWAAGQAEAIDASGKFADSINIAYESLQSLEYAQQRSGGSTDELRGDLDKLTKTMSSPIPGEYNQVLMQLGVSARDSAGNLRGADDVLLDIAQRMEGMSKQRQVQFAEKLGISPGTIKLLQNGKKGIQDLQVEAVSLGIVLEENAKVVAAKFQDSLLNSRSVVDSLGKSIAIGLLPAMGDTLDMFTGWISANREFITGSVTQVIDGVSKGFAMFGDILSSVYDTIITFTGPLGGLVEGLDATQAIAILVTGALIAMAVAVLAATWPIIAIGAAIAAVVLIIEDIYAALNGGESIIGGWVSNFTEAYPAISGVLGQIMDLLGALAEFAGGYLSASFKAWLEIITAVFGAVVDQVKNVMGAIESIISGADPFEALGKMFAKQVDIILNLAKSLGDSIVGFIGGIFGDTEIKVGGASASAAMTAPVPAGVVQGAGSATTVNNNVTNNINGAGNPGAVATEVINRGGLGKTLQQSRPGLTGPTVS